MGTLSEEISEIFPIWRIWKETKTPLKEIMEKWTYEDVRQANAVLDMYCDHDIARNAYITANRNRE